MRKKGRNPCGNLSCFSRGRSRKSATTQWTMSKLITIILAVVLLALIIYGTQSKGFGPLVDNIKGRFDSVLILFGKGGDIEVGCGTPVPQKIEGMDGSFYPCEDHCTFALNPPSELLTFSNFSIGGRGFEVIGKGGVDDDDAYSFGSAEAEKHRKAYELLNDTVGEFLVSDNMDYDNFVEAMDFGEGMTLLFEVEDWGRNTFYEYNGNVWRKGTMKDGKIVGSRISENDVIKGLWRAYGKGDKTFGDWIIGRREHEITWSQRGDGKSNIFMTDFNKNFKNDVYKEKEYNIWFYEITEKAREVGTSLTIEIDDNGFNTFYMFNGRKWERPRWFLMHTEIGDDWIFEHVYSAYKKGYEIVWRERGGKLGFSGDRVPVSNEKILEQGSSTREDDFKKWFIGLRQDWSDSKKAQGEVLKKLDDFLNNRVGDKYVDNPIKIILGVVDEETKIPMMSFVVNVERFGLYYWEKEPALIYNTKDSVVSDFVWRSDSDWEKFIKINKIYEYFKSRRCGK